MNCLSKSAIMLILQVRRNGMIMTISFTSPPVAIELCSSGRAKRTSRPICLDVARSFLSASSGFSSLHEAHHPSGSTWLADHALPHCIHSLVHTLALALTHHPALVVWYPSSTKSSAPIRIRSCWSTKSSPQHHYVGTTQFLELI